MTFLCNQTRRVILLNYLLNRIVNSIQTLITDAFWLCSVSVCFKSKQCSWFKKQKQKKGPVRKQAWGSYSR